MDIRVGDRVSVRWDETNKRFNATVEVIHDMPWSFDVLYDEKVRGKPCVEKKVSMERVLRFGSPSPTHPQRGNAAGEDLFVVDDGDGVDEEEEELFRSFHVNEDEDDGMYWGEGTIESAAAAVAAAAATSGSGSKRKEGNILKYLSQLCDDDEGEGKEALADVKLTVNQILQLHDALTSHQIAEMVASPGHQGRGLLEVAATLLNDALMNPDVDSAFDASFQGCYYYSNSIP